MPASSRGNVFITGAAAGIRAAATRLLASGGYTVYAGVHKDTGSLDRIAGAKAASGARTPFGGGLCATSRHDAWEQR